MAAASLGLRGDNGEGEKRMKKRRERRFNIKVSQNATFSMRGVRTKVTHVRSCGIGGQSAIPY
jgi:hypothetical protein